MQPQKNENAGILFNFSGDFVDLPPFLASFYNEFARLK